MLGGIIMKYEFHQKGVCSKKINFSIENNEIHDLKFVGGCQGNLKALGILLEGKKPEEVIKLLEGNTCGARKTSCADQLAKALKLALKNEHKGDNYEI